jgi:DNA-binding NarL/FixJ family response regulator
METQMLSNHAAGEATMTPMPSNSVIYERVDQSHIEVKLGTEFDPQQTRWVGPEFGSLSIGLIDDNRFTQDCLTGVLNQAHPKVSTNCFGTVRSCIEAAPADLNLIIYYVHGEDISDAATRQSIVTICQAFPEVPVIIVSDVCGEHQSEFMNLTLKVGARGFIPTQTASLSITLAAIRLVSAGGTFVPADLLFQKRPNRADTPRNQLTSRQGAVLNRLRQGKANKIIAYELGMSESTVKVHVRNIMRKMGATNRTQVAYKARSYASLAAEA